MASATDDSGGTLSWNVTLGEGNNSVLLRAVDSVGNTQAPPYTTMYSVVDTVKPAVGLTTRPPLPVTNVTNVNTTVVCVNVDDATAITASLYVDGVRVAVNSDNKACTNASVLADGVHVVTATAVDDAGNAANAPPLSLLVDTVAPAVVLTSTLSTRCGSSDTTPVIVCPLPTSAAFTAACAPAPAVTSSSSSPSSSSSSSTPSSPSSVTVSTSACWAQWSLAALDTSGCGHSVTSVDQLTWNNVDSGGPGRLDLAALIPNKTAQYTLYARAVDAAGNVGPTQTLSWWVDPAPPQPPTLVSHPLEITVSTAASFWFNVSSSASPGQLRLAYTLSVAAGGTGEWRVLEVRGPMPTTDAVANVSLTNLSGGTRYQIAVSSVSQAGVACVNPVVYTWQVLPSEPSVRVVSQPQRNSGTSRPSFIFAAVWAGPSPPGGDVVRFEVLLLGDANLGEFHTPAVCNPAKLGTLAMLDCVGDGCNGTSCSYTVVLSESPGTSQPYTLQVRTVFAGTPGDVTTLQWVYQRCAVNQFAVLANGSDSVSCVPCPPGGDCASGVSNAVVDAAALSNSVDPSGFAGVVFQTTVAAMVSSGVE